MRFLSDSAELVVDLDRQQFFSLSFFARTRSVRRSQRRPNMPADDIRPAVFFTLTD
jgi:hypothetical protein